MAKIPRIIMIPVNTSNFDVIVILTLVLTHLEFCSSHLLSLNQFWSLEAVKGYDAKIRDSYQSTVSTFNELETNLEF